MSALKLDQAALDALRNQYGLDPERAKYLAGLNGNAKVRVADGARAEVGAVSTSYVNATGPHLEFPIRLVLPWSALISENRRFCARASRIFMTAQYKAARERIVRVARAAMSVEDWAFQPLAIPLALTARVWFPDNRIHDAPNFAGATHNALKKIVFVDDQWLHRATWERAGVDVDRPRAEIEIRPL